MFSYLIEYGVVAYVGLLGLIMLFGIILLALIVHKELKEENDKP